MEVATGGCHPATVHFAVFHLQHIPPLLHPPQTPDDPPHLNITILSVGLHFFLAFPEDRNNRIENFVLFRCVFSVLFRHVFSVDLHCTAGTQTWVHWKENFGVMALVLRKTSVK